MRSGKCVRTTAQLTRPRESKERSMTRAMQQGQTNGMELGMGRLVAPRRFLMGNRGTSCTTRCSHYHFGYANVNRPTYHGRDANRQLRLSTPMESRRRSVTPSTIVILKSNSKFEKRHFSNELTFSRTCKQSVLSRFEHL